MDPDPIILFQQNMSVGYQKKLKKYSCVTADQWKEPHFLSPSAIPQSHCLQLPNGVGIMDCDLQEEPFSLSISDRMAGS